jgi:hypothetical protein
MGTSLLFVKKTTRFAQSTQRRALRHMRIQGLKSVDF